MTAKELRVEIARLRAGEADTLPEPGVWPTPAQWIRMWNEATPEQRLQMAARVIADAQQAERCFLANHEWQIEQLRQQVEPKLRIENYDPGSPEDLAARKQFGLDEGDQ
jgi:hypothetical protein